MFTFIFWWISFWGHYSTTLLLLMAHTAAHSHLNYGNRILDRHWRKFTFSFLPERCAQCVTILHHFSFFVLVKKVRAKTKVYIYPPLQTSISNVIPKVSFNFVQNVWWHLFRTRFHFYIQNYNHRKLRLSCEDVPLKITFHLSGLSGGQHSPSTYDPWLMTHGSIPGVPLTRVTRAVYWPLIGLYILRISS